MDHNAHVIDWLLEKDMEAVNFLHSISLETHMAYLRQMVEIVTKPVT